MNRWYGSRGGKTCDIDEGGNCAGGAVTVTEVGSVVLSWVSDSARVSCSGLSAMFWGLSDQLWVRMSSSGWSSVSGDLGLSWCLMIDSSCDVNTVGVNQCGVEISSPNLSFAWLICSQSTVAKSVRGCRIGWFRLRYWAAMFARCCSSAEAFSNQLCGSRFWKVSKSRWISVCDLSCSRIFCLAVRGGWGQPRKGNFRGILLGRGNQLRWSSWL